MSLQARLNRSSAAQQTATAERRESSAEKRLTRSASLPGHFLSPANLKNTPMSAGAAANTLNPHTALALRNSPPPTATDLAELKPKSPAGKNLSLPLTAENLARLGGGEARKTGSGSETSSVITTVTERLKELGIEDIPQPGLPDIEISEPKLIKKIGRGYYGQVWLAQMEHEGSLVDVAVKKARRAADILDLKKETSFAAKINHPNIVKTYGYYPKVDGAVMRLAMGNIEKIDPEINDKLPHEKPIIRRSIIKQTIDGRFHIFRNRISHNDDHWGNFFYMKGGRVVLGDFGRAKMLPSGYGVGDAPFCETDFYLGCHSSIPIQDQELVHQIQVFSKSSMGKHEQRKLRETYIQLWANSQKWDCLSNAELAAKIEPLLEKDAAKG
jgi:Protein kinase domain